MRLIDADALLETLNKEKIRCDADVNYFIMHAPTIEERKTGIWHRRLDTRFGPKLNDIIICSECWIAFSTEDMIRRSYCPNCGARMMATTEGDEKDEVN